MKRQERKHQAWNKTLQKRGSLQQKQCARNETSTCWFFCVSDRCAFGLCKRRHRECMQLCIKMGGGGARGRELDCRLGMGSLLPRCMAQIDPSSVWDIHHRATRFFSPFWNIQFTISVKKMLRSLLLFHLLLLYVPLCIFCPFSFSLSDTNPFIKNGTGPVIWDLMPDKEEEEEEERNRSEEEEGGREMRCRQTDRQTDRRCGS